MKWIRKLMTWLDWWMRFLWTYYIKVLMVYQVHERDEGKDPCSLQLQNLCSVTAMHAVDRPHRVRFFGTWPKHCYSFVAYNCRSTRALLGRPGMKDVDRSPCVCGRPAKGQVDHDNYESLFKGVLFTVFWMDLGGSLATPFGLIWLYVGIFWADILHGYSGCIGI